MKTDAREKIKEVVLVGNPNTGKTTVFNALTGLRHSTANYPGVTVEKREGTMRLAGGEEVSVIDLPGAYSLEPRSPDEQVVRDVLLGCQKGTPPPDLVVMVLDAHNLERNLYLATQVIELGLPAVLVLNMWDMAKESGIRIDLPKLEAALGVPCVPTVGMKHENIGELKRVIGDTLKRGQSPFIKKGTVPFSPEERYARIERIVAECVERVPAKALTVSEKLDRVLTHRIWGVAVFIGVMGFIFQSIFTWAEVPMDLISKGIDLLGALMRNLLPAGPLESLVVEGMIAGVGNVVIFLPQIFLLFFFIALFEDTGYMARAVFVLDRIMKAVGLNGKAFLPLLSSFACAVPGVMASRTIEDRNDRLATILVAPLMSCSARLPVYTLMIAACVPANPVFGVLNLQSVTMISMYVLSLAAGLGVAAIFRKTFLRGNQMPFVFELPPYRVPHLKTVLLTMWDRGKEFLVRAGSIIFLLSIVLWFLVNYPKDHSVAREFEAKRAAFERTLTGEELEARLTELGRNEKSRAILSSYAGRLGTMIEPAIRPLGFNWEIGIGLVASFAAREVIVSTLAILYHVGSGEDDEDGLVSALQRQHSPVTGKPVYTPLVAVSLMVFYVLACQCLSTVAVVKRETGTWGWPVFMILYMSALAWAGSFVVYQGGRLLGFQ